MMLIGASVRGGRVHARWPGLEEHQLEAPGDLRVTMDYRDVLCEVLVRHSGSREAGAVFPSHKPRPVGVLDT
jgi:uncharacterized protein (DUF1501 family)